MKTFSGYVELMIERLVLDQLLVVLSKEEGFEKIPNLPWCFGPMLKTLRLILAASKSDSLYSTQVHGWTLLCLPPGEWPELRLLLKLSLSRGVLPMTRVRIRASVRVFMF